MDAMLECHSLTKAFGNLQAINALDLQITTGVSTGLVGPNGAGKTTLFSLICGFLLPDRGTIRVLGHAAQATALKGRIGLLPQDISLCRGIAVSEQLYLFARLQGLNRSAARAEAKRILSFIRAGELAKQFPETLSYGQRKKITLAQAMLGNPEVILLDEPTSGLDPVAARHIRSLIQEARATHTCIVSSHNLEEIKSVCDDVVVIDRGKLVKHCKISDLLDSNRIFNVLLEEKPDEALLQSLRNNTAVVDIRQDAPADRRLYISFQHDSPRQFRQELLDCLDTHDANVVEFSRGDAFTDKVIELVGGSGS